MLRVSKKSLLIRWSLSEPSLELAAVTGRHHIEDGDDSQRIFSATMIIIEALREEKVPSWTWRAGEARGA